MFKHEAALLEPSSLFKRLRKRVKIEINIAIQSTTN